jgi:protein-S-isoprenylcysteine O-methyltransferase Ste14
MKRLWIAARSLVYMTGFFALWGWIALSVRRFDHVLGLALPEVLRPAGVVTMVLGACLGLVCVGTLVTLGRGTPAPFDPPSEFVARGPYRFARNPMYISGLFLLFGLGLYEKSAAIVVFVVLLSLLVHLGVVYLEEPDLARRFGESYQKYKKAVNRWLPKMP